MFKRVIIIVAMGLFFTACSSDKNTSSKDSKPSPVVTEEKSEPKSSKKSTESAEVYSVEGAYYSGAEDYGGGDYSPEELLVIEGNVITTYSVHNGAVVIDKASYEVNGNKINVKSESYGNLIYNCNGEELHMEGGEAVITEVEFRRTEKALILTADIDGVVEEMTEYLATKAQESRIKALPVCTIIN